VEALNEALEALARKSGLRPKPAESQRPPEWSIANGDGIGEWLEAAAARLNLEARAIETPYIEVAAFLRKSGPAIIRIDFHEHCRYLVVVKSGKRVLVLAPDLTTKQIEHEVIRAALCRPLETRILPEVERLSNLSCLNEPQRQTAITAILKQHLSNAQIEGCWLMRLSDASAVRHHLREQRLLSRIALFGAAHILDSMLLIVSWTMIGHAVLQGRLDKGWLIAWTLTLLSRLPLQLGAAWLQGTIYLRGGAFLKRRLLAGSLGLRPEDVRREGIGQTLGRVIESSALESLTLGGGLGGLMSIVEVVVAACVLGFAAHNHILVVLLMVWTALIILLAWRQYRARGIWTDERLKITNDLVESMIGHRTRLVQQPLARWHEAEDIALTGYVEACRRFDRRLVQLTAIAPRGWLLLALLGAGPGFLAGDVNATSLAIAFGGILLAHGALGSLTRSLIYFGAARIAWEQVRPLFEDASRQETPGMPEVVVSSRKRTADDSQVLIEAHQLNFQHEGRTNNVLNSCNLKINHGDHVLLEGPSGSGKSTLASILAGLRCPQSGLILLHGLDRQTLGPRTWRRLIAAAPQFHENHVLSGTLAFNLLMGRQWPPTTEDCVEAERVCREVGLGDLLDRMPAGLFQVVGETGWQLSHGERSRLFLARTLLQGTDSVILDETMGALDPESIQVAMDCVFRRSQTLMLIAHP